MSLFRGCLAALPRGERRLLESRAGNGAAPLSPAQTAVALRISPATERALESRALRDLDRVAAGGCAGGEAAAASGPLVSAISGAPMLEPTVLLSGSVPALVPTAPFARGRGAVLGAQASSGSLANAAGIVPTGVFRPLWASLPGGSASAGVWAALAAALLLCGGLMLIARSRAGGQAAPAAPAGGPADGAGPVAAITAAAALEQAAPAPARAPEPLEDKGRAPEGQWVTPGVGADEGHAPEPARPETERPRVAPPEFVWRPPAPSEPSPPRGRFAASGRPAAAIVASAVGSLLVRALLRRGRR